MKAVLCTEWGGPERLTVAEVPSPPLRAGQVRIRVHACGLNFADTLQIAGKYQVKPALPFTPGLESAGEIVELASEVAGGLRVGQRVMAVSRRGGAMAEEVAVDARAVVPIPDDMDFPTAAGFPVAYGTAHLALGHRGHLQAGETLVVLGAAGGVGLAAIEIGRMGGARVIAAAGSAEKCATARAHGAAATIDYRQEDLRERILALTDGRGADVVFDPVGGEAFEQCFRAMNWEGRMLVIGFAAGRIQTVPANLILLRNISVTGVVWGAQAERDPAQVSANLAELLGAWTAGHLQPRVSKSFALPDIAEAMSLLLSRDVTGKIVLTT